MGGRHRARRLPVTRFVGAGAAVTSVALALGSAGPAGAVANGAAAPDGAYGFAAKLTMTDIPRPDGSHYTSACSAALVAPRFLLTAGHCFHDVNGERVSGATPYPTTATVGRTDESDTDGHVAQVIQVMQFPGGDVALAKLDQSIHDVAPIRLSATPPRPGDVLRLAGWGAESSDNPTPSTHLRTGQVEVTSVTETTVGVRGYQPHADTSACPYDSGAPYFLEGPGQDPRLVSLESGGPACPHDQEETTSRVDLSGVGLLLPVR